MIEIRENGVLCAPAGIEARISAHIAHDDRDYLVDTSSSHWHEHGCQRTLDGIRSGLNRGS